MKILLTGRNGQLGWELERALAPLGEVVACDHATLDLADPDRIVSAVRSIAPEVIVNAAAYTAVDKAESEPDAAFAINAKAPGILAEEAKRVGALLVHYSTDYVFDGRKATPYVEDDPPNPLNVYGRTKLDGERAIRQSECRHLILRISWVYGARGRNFLLTMLRRSTEGSDLQVVDNQLGAPTWCRDIAGATARMLGATVPGASGLFHMSASGETTWFGFAKAALELRGLRAEIRPIPSSQCPAAAARPKNSLLDNTRLSAAFAIEMPCWRRSLESCLREIP